MSLPITVQRLSVVPISVCGIFPGTAPVIPLGGIPGPPGPLAERIQAIVFVIDGGGAQLAPGIKGDLVIPYECNVLAWTLVADRIGTVEVDVERDGFLLFPPTAADSITGANRPKLVNSQIAQAVADGWFPAVPANSILRYVVINPIDVQRLTVTLTVERS